MEPRADLPCDRFADTGNTSAHTALIRRQLSIRDDVSLFAAHPPVGLRARMLASWPAQPAAVILTEAESARIDEELAKRVERVRRDIAATGY